MNETEEGNELKLDFSKLTRIAGKGQGVIPVAVQNVDSGDVILVAYTNETAFRKAVETRSLVLWSTSRNELWEKGKTSGQTFELVEAFVNCEQNSLLYRVRPRRNGIRLRRPPSSRPSALRICASTRPRSRRVPG